MTVFVVTVRSINGGEYHSKLDAPVVFASEEAALKWVSQDLCSILSIRSGRTVHLLPTWGTGTEWSGVIQLNGRDFPLGIRVNLTTSTLIGVRAVAVNPAYEAHVTVSLSSKWTHSRSQP